MRITIAFPSYPTIPFGGFKVLFEYANRLAARGHALTLIHPRTVGSPDSQLDRAKSYMWPYKLRLLNHGPAPGWFALDRAIEVRIPRSLAACKPPDADVLIATSWRTAQWVAAQPRTKGEKFYFVQDYEYWAGADPARKEEIAATLRLGLRHIAISDAVRSMLEASGARAEVVIRSGIDHDVFYLSQPIDARPPGSVAFPLRREPFKATADAVSALGAVREILNGSIRAFAYGSDLSHPLPDWIELVHRPTDPQLRELLNSVAVFVLPSHHEGFGLTGLEAMACGAALLAADSGGVRDYARDGETAIVVPARSPDLIADALVGLIHDPTRRRQIASRGLEAAQQFTWESSVATLEEALCAMTRAPGTARASRG